MLRANATPYFTSFGTREDILRTAIRSCAETEALAHETLRVLPTGREAVLAMLEENVRLRRHSPRYCGCLFTSNTLIVPVEETDLHEFLVEKRRALTKHIRGRLVQSVTEGELPPRVNCEALANLCITFLGGLTLRVLDGTSPGLLFRSIEVFVNSFGASGRAERFWQRRHGDLNNNNDTSPPGRMFHQFMSPCNLCQGNFLSDLESRPSRLERMVQIPRCRDFSFDREIIAP
jgi:hypothetical protein